MAERRQCHGKRPPPLAAPHGERRQHGRASSSFSASLLDAIYHSLDEGGGAGAIVVDDATRRRPEEGKAAAPPQFWWAKEAARQKQAAAGSRREMVVARPRHSGYASSTTSSSESSSSYSFSCSSASTTDTESTRRRRHSPPPPPQPEEAAVDSAAPAPRGTKAKKKSRPCFPGARIRPRGAVPSSPSGSLPASPARFACVLKALFTSARLSRKPKIPTAVPPPQTSTAIPPPSCMPATPATKAAERRSVRFCPDGGEASVVRRRVEELVRSLGEVEEDENASDSSSDLFELESLRGDELPVYGTTSLTANRAIAQGTGRLLVL